MGVLILSPAMGTMSRRHLTVDDMQRFYARYADICLGSSIVQPSVSEIPDCSLSLQSGLHSIPGASDTDSQGASSSHTTMGSKSLREYLPLLSA